MQWLRSGVLAKGRFGHGSKSKAQRRPEFSAVHQRLVLPRQLVVDRRDVRATRVPSQLALCVSALAVILDVGHAGLHDCIDPGQPTTVYPNGTPGR